MKMTNLKKDSLTWEKNVQALSNNVYIGQEIVCKHYIKNDFTKKYGNQESKIIDLLPRIQIKEHNKTNDYICITKIQNASLFNDTFYNERVIKVIAQQLFFIHSIDKKIIKKFKIKSPKFKKTWKYLKHLDYLPNYPDEDKVFKSAMKIMKNNPVICNNDLVDGNILLERNNSVTFIDYEYGGYNNRVFDLASFVIKRQINEEQEKMFLDAYEVFYKINMSEYLIAKKFFSYFWSKWALVKYHETSDDIYKDIETWLSKRWI